MGALRTARVSGAGRGSQELEPLTATIKRTLVGPVRSAWGRPSQEDTLTCREGHREMGRSGVEMDARSLVWGHVQFLRYPFKHPSIQVNSSWIRETLKLAAVPKHR